METRDREEDKRKSKVFTEIVPFSSFYLAEPYHQKYRLQQVPDLMKEFRAMYPDTDGFVASTAAARVNGYIAGYGTLDTLRDELTSFGLSEEGSKKLLNIVSSLKQ